jgi:lipoprotein-anchoring transpeptidase ErfK/SrfK
LPKANFCGVVSPTRIGNKFPEREFQEIAMIGRFVTGLVCAAGLMAVVCTQATAQRRPADPANYDQRVTGNDPVARFFGFNGGSPVARTTVSFATNHKPGTIVIRAKERRLYLVLGNGQALSYGIGVGRDGFGWSGVKKVSAKREWPDWTPPEQMLRRRPDLPRYMPGGPDNPLGARALYLGSSLYRIHGSNEPETIGQAVSSGCFRLTNADVIDLYDRVPVGTKVIVRQAPPVS